MEEWCIHVAMDDFDKLFNKGAKSFKTLFIVNLVMGIGLSVAVIAVAWHFIAKFW